MVSFIISRLVSHSSKRLSLNSPIRSARIFICFKDSSPDLYSTLYPLPASLWHTCKRSVDFPIPGSPPTRVSDPGTMPPPNTLSNSSMPVPILSSFSMDTWESLAGSAFSPAWPGLADDPAFLPPDTTRSSTIEFHALQPGHCPIHFADSYPHS